MDAQHIRDTIQNLQEFTIFAASTGEDKYMDMADKLSRAIMGNIAVDKAKEIKSSDIADMAISKICCEMKNAAVDNADVGMVTKTFVIKNERQEDFITQASKRLEEDGFAIGHQRGDGEMYVEIRW